MQNLLDNIYDIKNIIAVKFKDNYKEYLDKDGLENIIYFSNTYYFLNREVIENADGTYEEIYEDGILGNKLFERIVKDNNTLPDFIEEIIPFELQGLSDEETMKGLVGSSKLFYNFQIINQKEENKVKKIGIRRVG